MNKLQFHTEINAPAEKVWSILVGKDTYPQWIGVSWPTSYYEGEWREGERIKFISSDGSGTLGVVIEQTQAKLSRIQHQAVLLPNGIEDRESEDAKGWIGTTECYTLVDKGHFTRLVIEIETNPSWVKLFEDGIPAALNKLKELCEQ
jgi:uncharacterized protein YndB with AHSA1/START domain